MADSKPARRSVRTGRPPKHEREAAGARIIEAATRLFASRGFAGTSVEQVAVDCGAGKDTIYRRYPSKVALFEGVVEEARGRALEKLAKLDVPTGDALQRLRTLMRSLLDINMEPDFIALKRIAFSEAVVFGKRSPLPAQPDPIMATLVKAVEAAQEGGFLRSGDTEALAAYLIHGLVSIPTTEAMLGGIAYGSPDALDRHFETVWEWLLEGISDH